MLTPVVPLHAGGRAADPIVAVDGRGVITTRGAGRVRGRHELETEFSLYLPLYFENRTYDFVIEDTVAAGGSSVTFTYSSVGAPSGQATNLRAWKVYGGGNVFHQNVNMQRLDTRRFAFTVDANTRDHRPMQRGDLLEFEFGIFLDAAQVPGRTNYYTDTFRYRVGEGGLTASNTDPALGELGPPACELSGGDVTIPYIAAEPEMSFSQMALNIQPATAPSFVAGRRLFHTSLLSGAHSEPGNPVFEGQKNKTGPLYNEESCSSCHLRNGRGAPPEPGSSMKSMVVKVFGPRAQGADGTPAHPLLGRQIQNHALAGAVAEGDPTITYETSERRLPDGTVVQLQKPVLVWRGNGCAPERFSMRISRPLVGLGLLEAVPESAILARADPGDCNQDVISGRPNLVRTPRPASCASAAWAGRRARSASATRSPTPCWWTWGSPPRSSPWATAVRRLPPGRPRAGRGGAGPPHHLHAGARGATPPEAAERAGAARGGAVRRDRLRGLPRPLDQDRRRPSARGAAQPDHPPLFGSPAPRHGSRPRRRQRGRQSRRPQRMADAARSGRSASPAR